MRYTPRIKYLVPLFLIALFTLAPLFLFHIKSPSTTTTHPHPATPTHRLRNTTQATTTLPPTHPCSQPSTTLFTHHLQTHVLDQTSWITSTKTHICHSTAEHCSCNWASPRLCSIKKIDASTCNAICCCETMIDTSLVQLMQAPPRLCTSPTQQAHDSRNWITTLLSKSTSLGCECSWVQFDHCHPFHNDGSPCWRACCTLLHKQQFLLRVERHLMVNDKDTDISFPSTVEIPPWKSTTTPKKEKFVFQDVDDLLPNHFGSTHTRMPLKRTLCRHGLLPILCSKTTVLKCISCLLSWYVLLNKNGKHAHDVLSRTSHGKILFYESAAPSTPSSIAPLSRLDIGIPFGCNMKKLTTFLKFLPDDIQYDTRLVVTNFQNCGYDSIDGRVRSPPTNKDISTVIRRHANKKVKHYKVIDVSGKFQRAVGCNVLHDAARENSILTVLDVDMRVQSLYFQRAMTFASTNVSIYFPIVWR